MGDPDRGTREALTVDCVAVDDEAVGDVLDFDHAIAAFHCGVESIAGEGCVGHSVAVDTASLEHVIGEGDARHGAADAADRHREVALSDRDVVSENVADDRDRAVCASPGRLAVDVLIAGLSELVTDDDEVMDVTLNRDPTARAAGECRADHRRAPNEAVWRIADESQTVSLSHAGDAGTRMDNAHVIDAKVLNQPGAYGTSDFDRVRLLIGVCHLARVDRQVANRDVARTRIYRDHEGSGRTLIADHLNDRTWPRTHQFEVRAMGRQRREAVVRAGWRARDAKTASWQAHAAAARAGRGVHRCLNGWAIVVGRIVRCGAEVDRVVAA